MEFWHEMALRMSLSLNFFELASLAKQFYKISFSCLNRAILIKIFCIMKQDFFILIDLFMQHIYFACYIALYDKRKVGCHTLNDHGNLMVDHGIIKETSGNFISYFLWEPFSHMNGLIQSDFECLQVSRRPDKTEQSKIWALSSIKDNNWSMNYSFSSNLGFTKVFFLCLRCLHASSIKIY